MEPSPNGTRRRPDPVAAALDEVKADLAARRAAGELPELREGDLDRQFSAVVETLDGTLLDQPAIDLSAMGHQAHLATFEPGAGGLVGRLLRPLKAFWSRAVGYVVRRQVGPYAQRSTDVVSQIADRQQRMLTFLGRVHLDRVRSLEYRVAELEREVQQLRAAASADDGTESSDGH